MPYLPTSLAARTRHYGGGVVVTLLYLALQIRQNSRSVRSASAQAMLGSLGQTISAIACQASVRRNPRSW